MTIRDEKMSKSLNNFLTIREVLEQYPPEVIRLFIFSTQYRHPLDFSKAALQDAEAGLDRMYDCLARIAGCESGNSKSVFTATDSEKVESLRKRFEYAMDNDFNTAQGVGLLFDTVKALNKVVQATGSKPSSEDLDMLQKGGEAVRELAGIMGLLRQDAVAHIESKKQKLLVKLDITIEDIEKMILDRAEARQKKDWAAGDAIRDKLLLHGIELQDGADGTTWDVKL